MKPILNSLNLHDGSELLIDLYLLLLHLGLSFAMHFKHWLNVKIKVHTALTAWLRPKGSP